jgi:hypothetical protein
MAKSRFLGQYATGDGINRYIQDVNGLGLDATFDPVNGFHLINSTGWFLSYEQWWSQKWISVFTMGDTESELTDTLPDNTYQFADYATANIIYLPVERMGVAWNTRRVAKQGRSIRHGPSHPNGVSIQVLDASYEAVTSDELPSPKLSRPSGMTAPAPPSRASTRPSLSSRRGTILIVLSRQCVHGWEKSVFGTANNPPARQSGLEVN